MKKTLLAASIAALAATSAAQASVTLYENDEGTAKFYTFGGIGLQLQNYDGENQIQDWGSAIGFGGETQINDDLKAFASVEFGFNAGFENGGLGNDSSFEVSESFVGIESGFGTIKAGNFDSVYYTAAAGATDIMEVFGYRSFDNKGGGFTVAYESMDMGGLQLLIGLRHYSSAKAPLGENYPSYSGDDATSTTPTPNGKEQWNAQLGVIYSLSEELSFGFAFDQNNKNTINAQTGTAHSFTDAAGNTKIKSIFALSAAYETDLFGAVLTFEKHDKEMVVNLGGNYTYGPGDIYGLISYADNGLNNNNTGVDFALGANYFFADSFYVFGEAAVGNKNVSEVQATKDDGTIKGTTAVTLGAVYTW